MQRRTEKRSQEAFKVLKDSGWFICDSNTDKDNLGFWIINNSNRPINIAVKCLFQGPYYSRSPSEVTRLDITNYRPNISRLNFQARCVGRSAEKIRLDYFADNQLVLLKADRAFAFTIIPSKELSQRDYEGFTPYRFDPSTNLYLPRK